VVALMKEEPTYYPSNSVILNGSFRRDEVWEVLRSLIQRAVEIRDVEGVINYIRSDPGLGHVLLEMIDFIEGWIRSSAIAVDIYSDPEIEDFRHILVVVKLDSYDYAQVESVDKIASRFAQIYPESVGKLLLDVDDWVRLG